MDAAAFESCNDFAGITYAAGTLCGARPDKRVLKFIGILPSEVVLLIASKAMLVQLVGKATPYQSPERAQLRSRAAALMAPSMAERSA